MRSWNLLHDLDLSFHMPPSFHGVAASSCLKFWSSAPSDGRAALQAAGPLVICSAALS